MIKLFLMLVLLAVSIFLGYGIMTEGWGLQVQSWPWFILGNLGVIFIAGIISALGSIDS